MSTNELFALITLGENWWDGYCSAEYARVLKSRHKHGTLHEVAYQKLFKHFGYLPYWRKEG